MVRYVTKFEKGREVKFISHLDLLRCMQRAIRRAGIPISYSKGFNPHAEISFATPLAVGTASVGEYMDFKIDREIDEEYILKAMNENLPKGIRFIKVKKVKDDLPSLMGLVDAALYNMTIVNVQDGLIDRELIDNFKDRSSIMINKSDKNGEKTIDIKPMLYDLNLISKNKNEINIKALLATGSRNNLNPKILFDALKLNLDPFADSEIRDITKTETFVKKDKKFMVLMDIL